MPPSLYCCGSRVTVILPGVRGYTVFHCLGLKQPPGTVPVPECTVCVELKLTSKGA